MIAWIFAILMGLSAREYPALPGIVLCLIGATVRFWASGYLRKDTRPAVGGPYRHVRNPLYLGTYLMAVGTAWSIENYWLLGAVTLIFAIIYRYIILDEETKLQALFGEPYHLYCSLVPRFFPRLVPASENQLDQVNPERAHRGYSWELARKNKAYEAFASFAGLIGGVYLIALLWKTFY